MDRHRVEAVDRPGPRERSRKWSGSEAARRDDHEPAPAWGVSGEEMAPRTRTRSPAPTSPSRRSEWAPGPGATSPRGGWAATTRRSPRSRSTRPGTPRSTPASPCSTPPRSTGRERASGSSAPGRRRSGAGRSSGHRDQVHALARGSSTSHGSLLSALRRSLERLGLKKVALYQIHGPVSLRSHAALAEALAAAHHGRPGRTRSGCPTTRRRRPGASPPSSADATCGSPPIRSSSRCCDAHPRRPVCSPPARSSAWSRWPTRRIGQGRLTGKYSASNPPPGKRGFSAHPMEVVDVVVDELRSIGEKHGGKLPSQVALNWVIAKGAVPIPGRRTASRPRRTPARSAGASTETNSNDSIGPRCPGSGAWPTGSGSTAESPPTWRRRRLGSFPRRRHLGDRQRSLSGAHWL